MTIPCAYRKLTPSALQESQLIVTVKFDLQLTAFYDIVQSEYYSQYSIYCNHCMSINPSCPINEQVRDAIETGLFFAQPNPG